MCVNKHNKMKNVNAVLSASDERPNIKDGFSDTVFYGDNGNGKKCHIISDEDKKVGEPMYPLGTGAFVYDNNVLSKSLHGIPTLTNTGLISLQKDKFRASNKNERPKIIAAMPAYNEEEYVGSMVLGTRPYVDEVIVVDDGSSDRTARFAALGGARVIRHDTNYGKGKAIQTILEEAIKMDVDILILLDADCQHNPDEIPLLIEPIKRDKADMVNGSRFLDKKSKIPSYRMVGQHILTLSTNMCSGTSMTDSQSGFRALSKKAINSIKLAENGMGVESEMINKASESNLRIKEVPISCRYDVNGSTFNPVSHGLSVFGTIIHQLQRKRPLLYFSLPGLILLLVGGSLSLQTFFADSILGQFGMVKALMAIVLVLVGVFAMFSGLILNSVSSTIKELKSNDG